MNRRNLSYYVGLITLLLSPLAASYAQQGNVGIGTTVPDKSAILELSSDSGGLLMPRMTLTQKNQIVNPATGLLVFQTDFLSGFYYYDGTKWKQLNENVVEARQTAEGNWVLTGNAGSSATSNFIGTTDAIPLSFRINNERSGYLDFQRGNTFFGYRAGILSVGYNSIALGAMSMQRATTAGNNTALGYQSMFNNQTGDENVAVGSSTLVTNIAGQRNAIVGAQAGYRATGSGNVFMGYQAGYFEEGNSKLYIHNNSSLKPLVYGDFSKKMLGINSNNPKSVLSINSDTLHTSGLEFVQLTSLSPTQPSNQKVLSVDANGKVILVNDLVGTGTGTTVSSTWLAQGNDIINQNSGSVKVTNNLIVNSITDVVGLQVGVSNIQFKHLNSNSNTSSPNGKVLSLDNQGRVILVKDSVGTTIINNNGGSGTSYWAANGTNIENTNSGSVVAKRMSVSQDLTTWFMSVNGGGLQFNAMNSNTAPGEPNGKVLTLNESGMVVLVKASTSSGGSGTPSYWEQNGGKIQPVNNAKVVIGTGINSYPDGYRLYVKDGIMTERLRVAVANSAKWADYVFNKKYVLMPLKEVEAFILKYKHLPNMLSDKEMVKTGLDVAETSAKLLEKIEELTLYMIEANKKIEALEKKVNTLEQGIK